MKNTSMTLKFGRLLVAVIPLALVLLSACGGSNPKHDYHQPKGDTYSDGYLKLNYTDQAGTVQTLGTPLMKEGQSYEEVNVLQFPSVTPTDMSVELDLPETAVAKKKTEYFPVLEYGSGITDLIYRNEALQNTGNQIVFTTKIVYLNEFMPKGSVQGELRFQLADDSGGNQDELVRVRFLKNSN